MGETMAREARERVAAIAARMPCKVPHRCEYSENPAAAIAGHMPCVPYSPARCARPRMFGQGRPCGRTDGMQRGRHRGRTGARRCMRVLRVPGVSTQSRMVDGGRERAGQRGDTCLASWPDVFQVLSRSEAHPPRHLSHRGITRVLTAAQGTAALGNTNAAVQARKPTRLAAHLANAITDEPVADAVRRSLGCKYGIDVGCGGSAAHRGEGRDRWSGLDPLDSLVHGRCPCISYAYRARAHPEL